MRMWVLKTAWEENCDRVNAQAVSGELSVTVNVKP